jgi:hypothetical protein
MTKQEKIEFLNSKLSSEIQRPFEDESGLYFKWNSEVFYFNSKYNVIYSQVNDVDTAMITI